MLQADKIYYGGDYNPDQWDDATIEEDMRLFQKAGINLVTLPIFSWAKLEPEEGVYDFEWLDKIIDRIWKAGIHIALATPTSAQPAWLSMKYPEVLPVDIAGRKRTHGMRVFFCVNSLKYRERARAIAEQMAMRYAHHPALAMWHVANEYGTYCYCPTCQAKFRVWLRDRYGSVENLNTRWHTSFWGRTVYSFEEVNLPTELNDDYRFNPAVQLDYMRFVTDSTAECFRNERDILKQYNPDIPVQTNMSGFIKKIDQFTFTKNLDIVGWDNYPWPHHEPYFVAMKHDIMRGLKGGQSFLLTEQSPNQQNWQPYNLLKRPGEVRRLSYQAMAHGADSCLFFQLRQSIAGQEKFHGAVIAHNGREDTRVFRETATLGKELQQIGDAFLTARTPAKAAILMDWSNWWALELTSGPTKDMDYLNTLSLYYEPLFRQNIPVDIIPFDASLEGYDLVVAPMVYMMKGDLPERLHAFTEQGGTVVATVMTGIADENDRCIFGAYPGSLKDLFGMWVEETDALRPYEKNRLKLTEGLSKEEYDCGFLCDLIREEGADILATYQDDFYAGIPAITCNAYGKGKAYYIGTQPEQAYLDEFFEKLAKDLQLEAPVQADPGVEVTLRKKGDREILFVINHNKAAAGVDLGNENWISLISEGRFTGSVQIAPGDCMVLSKE